MKEGVWGVIDKKTKSPPQRVGFERRLNKMNLYFHCSKIGNTLQGVDNE